MKTLLLIGILSVISTNNELAIDCKQNDRGVTGQCNLQSLESFLTQEGIVFNYDLSIPHEDKIIITKTHDSFFCTEFGYERNGKAIFNEGTCWNSHWNDTFLFEVLRKHIAYLQHLKHAEPISESDARRLPVKQAEPYIENPYRYNNIQRQRDEILELESRGRKQIIGSIPLYILSGVALGISSYYQVVRGFSAGTVIGDVAGIALFSSACALDVSGSIKLHTARDRRFALSIQGFVF